MGRLDRMAIIDLVSRNELVDLDGPRALNLHSLKFFVLNDQVLPFPHLVTACDVLPGDRLAGFGVDILLTIGKMNMVALGRVVLTRREHVRASIDAEKKKAPSTQARRPAKKRAGQK
jgi:hypothetical protein